MADLRHLLAAGAGPCCSVYPLSCCVCVSVSPWLQPVSSGHQNAGPFNHENCSADEFEFIV